MNSLIYFTQYKNANTVSYSDYVYSGKVSGDDYFSILKFSLSNLHSFMNGFNYKNYKYFLKLSLDYFPSFTYLNFSIYLGSYLLYSRHVTSSEHEDIVIDLTQRILNYYSPSCTTFFDLNFNVEVGGSTSSQGTIYPSDCYVKVATENINSSAIPDFFFRDMHFNYTKADYPMMSTSISDCGTISYDSFNKNVDYSKHLFNIDANDVSFPFILMYDNHYKRSIITRPNVFNLPSGWYTSFDMFIIRKTGYSTPLGDKSITLINETGKRIEFNQKWYFYIYNERKYVENTSLLSTNAQGQVVYYYNGSNRVCSYEIISESGMIFIDKTSSSDAYITYQNGLKLNFNDQNILKSISDIRGVYKIVREGSYIRTYKNNSPITSQAHIDIQDQEITCDFGTDLYHRFSYNLSSGKISSLYFYRDDNLTGHVDFTYDSNGNILTVADDNTSSVELTYTNNLPTNIKYKSGVVNNGFGGDTITTPTIKNEISLSYATHSTIITDITHNLVTTQLFDFDSSIIKEKTIDQDNQIDTLYGMYFSTNSFNKSSLSLNKLVQNEIYNGTFDNDNTLEIFVNQNTQISSYNINYLEGMALCADLSSFNKSELVCNILNINIRLYNSSTLKHTFTYNYYIQNNEKIYIPFVFIKDSNRMVISYSFKRNVTVSLSAVKIYKSDSKIALLNERGLVGDSFSNGSFIDFEYNDNLERVKNTRNYDKSGNYIYHEFAYNSLGQNTRIYDNFGNLEIKKYNSDYQLYYVSKCKNDNINAVHYFNKYTYNAGDRQVSYSLQKNTSTNTYDTSYNTYYNNSNVLKETRLFNGNYTIHDIDSHTGNTYRYRFTSQLWDRTNYKYKNGLLKELASYSMYNRIGYTYDHFDRIKRITLPNDYYIVKNYTDNYNNSSLGITNGTMVETKSTSANTTREYYTKDSKLKRIKKGTNKNIDFTYDSLDRLTQVESKLNGVTDELSTITYNTLGRITNTYKTMNSKNLHNAYSYVSSSSGNSKGKLYSRASSVGGDTISETYGYDSEGKVTSINASDVYTQFTYDDINRITGILYKDINYNNLYAKSFDYYTDVRDSETNYLPLVHYLNNFVNNASQYVFGYKYDTTGNIVEETMLESPSTTKIAKQYTYDTFNRLILEKNLISKLSTHYTYNENGNMTSKVLYKLDNSGNELFVLDTKNYTYNTSSNWRDQLVNDSQYSISYNNYGYPYTYQNQSIGYDDFNNITSIGSNTYTYNNSGIRLTKMENGYKHLYYYDGSRLIKEEVLNASDNTLVRTLVFVYNNDEVIGFKLNGVLYYYIKNLTGDVIFIYRYDNVKVGEYSYGAFGTVSIAQDTNSVASINPFRFKSYYYDTETGLYYLISRYYSPLLMRFLTPDSIKYVNPDVINGVNLYMYCGYNPIMCSDPEGNLAFFVLTAIIGVAIGGTIFGVASYNCGKRGWSVVGWTALGMLGGGLVGAAAGAGAALLLTGKAAASISSVYYGAKAAAWAYSLGGAGGLIDFISNNLGLNNNYYPVNDGFASISQATLEPGQYIQRIGGEGGSYVSLFYTDPFSLSLPYDKLSQLNNISIYEVMKPIVVNSGPALPYFGQYGGGIQFDLGKSIAELIADGILKRF